VVVRIRSIILRLRLFLRCVLRWPEFAWWRSGHEFFAHYTATSLRGVRLGFHVLRLCVQTAGLRYTTASNSGFITGRLEVVLVR